MEIKKRILAIVRRVFPGSSVKWREISRGDRVGGRIVWAGFQEMDQLDRQQAFWNALSELDPEERQRVGTFFMSTPDELVAFHENAMENR